MHVCRFSVGEDYADGRIIAVVVDGELFLKTDQLSAPRFEEAGARRWTYAREGRLPVAMPYHSLPDDAWDDADRMAEWAMLAVGAALRHGTKKPATRKRRTPAS